MPSDLLLEMQNITKTFPGVRALTNASLQLRTGEIHALIGQNGAGKSTLIKILTGAYRRDSGSVRFAGTNIDFRSPQAAQNGGVSTIYQEVNLVPFRSVAENIFMGREPKKFGFIDWKGMNSQAQALLERFKVEIDVTQPLNTFNIAIQQMTAIARAVSVQAKLVVMDEPTSSLDEAEVHVLFDVMRKLKASGVSIIFVSHRLDELYAICDAVTIMRDGQTVHACPMKDISKLELVAKMLNRDLNDLQSSGRTGFKQSQDQNQSATLRLSAKNLEQGRALRGVNLEIKVGEIVGLAGLLGSGRTETARVLFGADQLTSGEIILNGQVQQFRNPLDAIKAGIGLCCEDRKQEGIIPHLSVRENLTLALLPQLTRAGLLRGIVNSAKQAEIVQQFIERLGIKTAGPDQPVRELSGGNQQKVLLARWMCMNPQLLILDEPTRGVDVGAKIEIQSLIQELAQNGLSVLMISSEIEELSEGSDRVVVLRDKKSVTTLEKHAISQESMMQAMAHGTTTHEVGFEYQS